MRLILGLGNPGREYADTRHNIGFKVLDILASRHDIDVCRDRFRSLFGEGRINGERVVLAKPQTYMNNSGWAARDLVNWYKCENGELIVIYDDVDIPLGTIRVREGGSAGTHNGMRSVIYQLGFDDFPRVRVGIGGPEGQRDMIAHVMSMPAGEERELLESALADAADAVELIARGELALAQAKFNKRPKKPKREQQDAEAALVQTETKENVQADE